MKFVTGLWILIAAGGGALAIWSEEPRGDLEGQVRQRGALRSDVRVALVRVPDGGAAHAASELAPIQDPPIQETNRPDENPQWFRASSDEAGRFSWRRVPEGRYQLIAQRGRWRDETVVQIWENAPLRVRLNLERIHPNVRIIQPVRDPEWVRRRTRDILGALPVLSRELLDTIRQNNRSGAVAGRESAIPLPILVAQAGAESSFRPGLAGELDEIGLFQLRPSTANDQGFGVIEPARLLDAGTSTRLASRYLGTLKTLFGDERLALGAYNQGPGRTEREGLYPAAQIYADAILFAARHEQLKRRVLELDPSLAREWNAIEKPTSAKRQLRATK